MTKIPLARTCCRTLEPTLPTRLPWPPLHAIMMEPILSKEINRAILIILALFASSSHHMLFSTKSTIPQVYGFTRLKSEGGRSIWLVLFKGSDNFSVSGMNCDLQSG